MNAKSIPALQVEIQDTAVDNPRTDGQTHEYSLLPGFINFYQNAQQSQRETGQLYLTNDADLRDMDVSWADDIPFPLEKKQPG